jgi:hypothetical protein
MRVAASHRLPLIERPVPRGRASEEKFWKFHEPSALRLSVSSGRLGLSVCVFQ